MKAEDREVVLHCGTRLGVISELEELEALLHVPIELFARHKKVRIEPHDKLCAVNGNSERRTFHQVGKCIHNGYEKAVVEYICRDRRRRIALVSTRFVLPPRD